MTHWIITDTHFGHKKMEGPLVCGRHPDCATRMLLNLSERVKPDDILIHLGDIAMGTHARTWNQAFTSLPGKKILVRGNHDKCSDAWYYNCEWDFVCNTFTLRKFGSNTLFSHKPHKDTGYDLNIHGHFHNFLLEKHERELVAIKNDKQVLLMVEHEYAPVKLESVVKKFFKNKNRKA